MDCECQFRFVIREASGRRSAIGSKEKGGPAEGLTLTAKVGRTGAEPLVPLVWVLAAIVAGVLFVV